MQTIRLPKNCPPIITDEQLLTKLYEYIMHVKNIIIGDRNDGALEDRTSAVIYNWHGVWSDSKHNGSYSMTPIERQAVAFLLGRGITVHSLVPVATNTPSGTSLNALCTWNGYTPSELIECLRTGNPPLDKPTPVTEGAIQEVIVEKIVEKIVEVEKIVYVEKPVERSTNHLRTRFAATIEKVRTERANATDESSISHLAKFYKSEMLFRPLFALGIMIYPFKSNKSISQWNAACTDTSENYAEAVLTYLRNKTKVKQQPVIEAVDKVLVPETEIDQQSNPH